MRFPSPVRLASFRGIVLGPLLFVSAAMAQTPNIVNTSFPPGAVGQFYSQALQAAGGTLPYTWSTTGQIPPGLTVNPAGSITGTPAAGGTYTFTLSVVDSRQASASRVLAIIIAGNGARLAVTTTVLPAGAVGQGYSQTLSATGGTPPYQWAAGPGFPASLALDAAGAVSGTPTSAGTFTFPVQVTDAANASATSSLSLTISAPPLSITTAAPLFDGTVGVSYVQTFRASGGAPPYRWSILSGTAGDLTLDAVTGNLQGTPQSAGTLNFTIEAADQSGLTATQPFALLVNSPTLGIAIGSALPAGAVGLSYSERLSVTATGGTPPYTWSLAPGSTPPAGLAFTPSTLTISGTPATAGTFNFILQVADSARLTASRSLSLVVNPAVLTITTNRQFTEATLNRPYLQVVAATGGRAPYRWTATGLPAGLVLNATSGQISGTPAAAGDFGIAITVIDAALANLSDRFTLKVNLPAGPGAAISGLPNTVGPAQQFPLQVTIDSAFPAPITGQAILTFSPDSGPADRTVQFSSGGTTAAFDIPTGSTTVDVPIAVQTGTVSGTINISLRLQAGGIDITPSPAPGITALVQRAAPLIRGAQVNRSGNTIHIVVTGFSTAREVTQAVFAFNATAGQSLQSSASSITVDVNTLFGNWFQDSNNSQFGSVFILSQPFTIQGDVNAVIPASVTLTNRIGSATFSIPQ